MKNLLFIVILIFGISAKSQIICEHTYNNASVDNQNQLLIVKFEQSGEKYVRIDRDNKTIDIYNMDHSQYKSISFAGFPQSSNNIPTIIYLSEKLFDNDSSIEFMYIYSQGNPSIDYTRIYNDDSSLLFKADSMSPLIIFNIHLQQYPIYNTSIGTKMILSSMNGDNTAKVFSLPGRLSSDIEESTKFLINSSNLISNPYPNPSQNTTQIAYTLPDGVNEGEIVFYDIQGNEIKRFKVDRTFNTLLISTADIAAGTYYYQLQTNSQASEGKKLIVIK